AEREREEGERAERANVARTCGSRAKPVVGGCGAEPREHRRRDVAHPEKAFEKGNAVRGADVERIGSGEHGPGERDGDQKRQGEAPISPPREDGPERREEGARETEARKRRGAEGVEALEKLPFGEVPRCAQRAAVVEPRREANERADVVHVAP